MLSCLGILFLLAIIGLGFVLFPPVGIFLVVVLFLVAVIKAALK